MTVYVVMAEYDEEHQVPIAVFDNEPAAQHKAKYTLDSSIVLLELQSIDNTPELMHIEYDSIFPVSLEDRIRLTPLAHYELYPKTTTVNRVLCKHFGNGEVKSAIDIIVEEKLLFDGWEEKALAYFCKLDNYATELYCKGKSDKDIREVITKQLKEAIKNYETI